MSVPKFDMPAPVPTPLVFPSDVSTANMTNVVLIERGFPQFQSYVNDKSFAIVYEPDSSIADLKALLRQKFTSNNIQRIALVSHYSSDPKFLEYESLFKPSDLVPGAMSFSKNTQGLIDILKEFHVANIDFLACKTLTDPNWAAFYSVLQSQANGVVVGASLDDTGNLKYGGNWVMENTKENVKSVYFNNSIDNYASLLDAFSVTYSFGVLNFSHTTGASTASLISVGTLTGAVTIPATVEHESMTVTVSSCTASFANQAGITSVVILAQITNTPNNMFQGCANLTSVTFPNTISATGFRTGCLRECGKLTYFNFPTNVTLIPTYFAQSTGSYDLVIPNQVTWVDGFAFAYSAIKTLYVPPGCYMASSSFQFCTALTDATIYSTGATAYQAMAYCVSLKNITFGPGITTMTTNPFTGTVFLTSVTLPSTLQSIDMNIFFDKGFITTSQTLKYLKIPSSVTSIKMKASANFVFDFMHETSFPTATDIATLPSSTIINVSKKVQNMASYLSWPTQFPNVTFNGLATVNFTQYTPTIPTSSGPTVDLSGISTANLTDTAVIGTTVAEQKQFTASTIKTLFSANTAQKQLILPIGSVLPGFSTSLEKPVRLFNASSTVANNKKTVLTKDEIISNTFYVLLEAGDSITLQSNNDSVVVSKTGSVFTITITSSNVSTTRVAGQTFAHDGLSLTLGSIYGTLTPTAVNFVLSALNNVITLGTAGVIPSYNLSLTSDATITLTNGITVAQAQNAFYFRTDDPITLDASFVYYYVDTEQWTNKAVVLSPKNGIVTSNAYVASDAVGKDFLRDLAKQLFGTHLGADLFTNEDAVISDINSKCDTVANNLISLLGSIDKTSGSLAGLQTDSSGNRYFNDNASTSNISRELFNQLMTNAVSRFSNIKDNYKKNAVEDGHYRMPILAGDSITFKMTISPASGQTAAVPTGPTALQNRTYTVILNVV